MVALVVEDGSNVSGANSYNSADEIIAYAADRNVTLVADDVPGMAIAAMDYLRQFNNRWKGSRTYSTQRLAWPREYAYIVDAFTAFPSDEIPEELKSAQAQLVIEISKGVALLPTQTNEAFIVREKTGPLETEYSEAVRMASGNLPTMPAVSILLADLIDGSSRLRSVRI